MELEIPEKRATVGRTATTKSQNEPHITMNFNCNPASQPATTTTITASTVAITTTAAGNKQQKESQKKELFPQLVFKFMRENYI